MGRELENSTHGLVCYSPQVVPMGFLGSVDTLGRKAAGLDPISRPVFHCSLLACCPRLGKSGAPPRAESPRSGTRKLT